MANWLNAPISPSDAVLNAFAVTLALIVGGLLATLAVKAGIRAVLMRSQLPATAFETVRIFRRGTLGLIWIVLALLILKSWGVSGSGLWTFLVSIATLVGVGFLATWTMVSNITASMFLTIWRPFYIGDEVELLPENFKGKVVDRNLMFIALEQDDGCRLQVPNNLFFQKMFRVRETHVQYGFDFAQFVPRTPRAKAPARPGAAAEAARSTDRV